MGDEEELEALRQKRIQQLKQQQESQEQQEEAREQAEQQKAAVMRQIMTPEARERLARLKIARPEFVEQIEQQLIMLVQSGQVREKITDAQLVRILEKLTPEKREINIKRI